MLKLNHYPAVMLFTALLAAVQVHAAGRSFSSELSSFSYVDAPPAAKSSDHLFDGSTALTFIKADAFRSLKTNGFSFALGSARLHKNGTPGMGRLTAFVNMTEFNLPFNWGALKLRADDVSYDAGSAYRSAEHQFGLVHNTGSSGRLSDNHKACGTALAAVLSSSHFNLSIGTTPQGFIYEDFTALVKMQGTFASLDFSAELYRRPKDNSLLSYGGQIDQVTGLSFGGVRRTGLKLSLNSDAEDTSGFRTYAAFEKLTGRRVADNLSLLLSAEGFSNLINQDREQLQASLTGIYAHFERNLGGYTLGQGGYFSPQQYLSIRHSLSFMSSAQNWSLIMKAAAGLTYIAFDDSERYPLKELVPETVPDKYGIKRGKRSLILFGQFQAALERQLSKNLTLGFQSFFTFTHTGSYNPAFAGLYLRYNFDDKSRAAGYPERLIPISRW